jgi:hypothetical protein
MLARICGGTCHFQILCGETIATVHQTNVRDQRAAIVDDRLPSVDEMPVAGDYS